MVIYNCETCNFTSIYKSKLTRHLNTKKHINNLENTFICECCNKKYACRQSLYAHQKNCKEKEKENDVHDADADADADADNKNTLLLSNNELSLINTDAVKNALAINDEEMEKKLKQILKDALQEILATNTLNTVTNNKNITKNKNINNIEKIENVNIQVFLNEHCKDAMTIQHFAKNLAFELEDLMNKNGKIFSGITNIVVDNLKPLSIKQRPIHCTDYEKSKWMVNDAKEGWTEDNGKKIITQTGIHIGKIFNTLWKDKYPNWQDNENMKDRWVKLVYLLTKEFSEEDVLRALKKISPECNLTYEEIKKIM